MEIIKARGTDSARVIKFIETHYLIGEGTQQNPCRTVKQDWEFYCTLLAEKDYYAEEEKE